MAPFDDFIKRFPCLWDKSDINFKDRVIKNRCRKQLLDLCNSVSTSSLTEIDIRRKVKSYNTKLLRRSRSVKTPPLSKDTDNCSGNCINGIQLSEHANHRSEPERAKRKAIGPRSAAAKRLREDLLDVKIEILSSSESEIDSEATVPQPESDHESALIDKDGDGYTAPGSLSYFLGSLKIPDTQTAVANLDTSLNSLESEIHAKAAVPQPESGHESALQDKDGGGYSAPESEIHAEAIMPSLETGHESASEDKDSGDYSAPGGEIHTGYSCDACKDPIRGFLYTCVQCQHEYCGACETLRAHDKHLVLRVPRPAPRDEIQSVLNKIREMFSLEPSEPSIKVEANEEEVLQPDPLHDSMDPNMENSRVPSVPAARLHEKSSIPERGFDQQDCRFSQTTPEIYSYLPGLTSDTDHETEQEIQHSEPEFNPQIESIEQKVQENGGTTDQFEVYSHNEVTVTQNIPKNVDHLRNTGTSLTHIITQSVRDDIKIYPTRLSSLASKETLIYFHGVTIRKPKVCGDNRSDITEPVNQSIALTNVTNNEKIVNAMVTRLNHIGTSQNSQNTYS